MKVERPGPTVEELVPLYYTALYRYAYRLTGNSSDAEDLTQETFCSAHAKRTQLREPERVKSWLFSILHNAFLVRQRKHRQASFAPEALKAAIIAAFSLKPSPVMASIPPAS